MANMPNSPWYGNILLNMPDAPTPKQGGGKKRRIPKVPNMPQGDNFWVNLATSVLLLLLLAGAYTYFVGGQKDAPENIPISQLAADIEVGSVSKIVVDG